jgi:PBSX family phage terminase large subunit
MSDQPMLVRYGALPKQYQFVTSTADEVLYSGAYGAGKTRALALWAVMRATHPFARVGLFRMRLQDLLNTTLATLLEGDGELPPLLPRGTYHHNQQRRVIRIHNAGQIVYDQLEDIERVASLNLSDAGVEEASETEQEHWEKIGKRCRLVVPGRTNQLAGACNPGPPSHHLAKRFGLKRGKHYPELAFKGDEKNPIRVEAVMTTAFENPFLPARYIARLASMTGVMYKRYALGEWVGNEGAVYDNWDRDVHVKTRTGPWARTFILIDDGTTVACAILLFRVDANGRKHVEREVQRRGMLVAEKLAVVASLIERHGRCEAIIVDPAAAGLKAELRNSGHVVLDGNNDVVDGIADVRTALSPGLDGLPDVTVDPSCVTLIEQMEGYEWDKGGEKERPVKTNDHGPDALRYGVRHLKAPPALVFDASGLERAEASARRRTDVTIGTMTHTHPAGREQDLSIAMRKVGEIEFEEVDGGPMRLWAPLIRGRPNREDEFALFAAAGDGQGGAPGIIVIADAVRRCIVGQWVKPTPPERLARVAAMLSLWYGGDTPAPVGYITGKLSTPGAVFGQHLERLGMPGDPWEPTPQEFAESIGVLRAAWEGGQLVERDPEVFSVARQYVYANATMLHASLVGAPERRGSHSDTLIARAGLWRMIAGRQFKPAPEREAPIGSPEYRRRQREAEKQRSAGLNFG